MKRCKPLRLTLFAMASAWLVPSGATLAHEGHGPAKSTVGVTVTSRRLGTADTLPGAQMTSPRETTQVIHTHVGEAPKPDPLPLPKELAPILPAGPDTFAEFLASLPPELIEKQTDLKFRNTLALEAGEAVRTAHALGSKDQAAEEGLAIERMHPLGTLAPQDIDSAIRRDLVEQESGFRNFVGKAKGLLFLVEAKGDSHSEAKLYLVSLRPSGELKAGSVRQSARLRAASRPWADLKQSDWLEALKRISSSKS